MAGVPPGGFVGRRRELDRISSLVTGPARLVTLVGSGGIGKSRLAEEAARRVCRVRRTPVWIARLARLPTGSDAAMVRDAVTRAVLAEGFVGASAWDGAAQQLSPRDAAGRAMNTLLVLDNCEHVLTAARAVIADLLDAVAGLTILATSRQPIGSLDEHPVAVPPLSAKDSLALFRQRAELTGRSIAEPAPVKLAQQICRHMHGNPLCIRLAAARTFYEPLSMIVEQLTGESDDTRMRWSHGPRAGLEARHRSIADVIAWSYELCTDKEQLLFDRLAVFAPGYDVDIEQIGPRVPDVGADVDAIEMACADDAPMGVPRSEGGDPTGVRLARTEIRELLDRLVEQSLLSVHVAADSVRYFLLESLRVFASERLAERSSPQIDEPARLARRHRYYYRNKVLQAQAEWFGPNEGAILDWVSGAWSNIGRAIDTSMTSGQPIIGLQICLGLVSMRAPFYVGSLPEFRSRIERALAASQTSQPYVSDLQLTAMAMTAFLTVVHGSPGEASELVQRCVAASGVPAAQAGQWRERPEIDIGLPAVVDFAWGTELMWVQRDPRAIVVLARAREKFHTMAFSGGEPSSELWEVMAAGLYGPADQAITIGRRHLEHTTAAGSGWARSWAQMALAIVLTKHGDANEALALGRDALNYQVAFGDQWGMTWVMHVRMWSLARLITDQATTTDPARSAAVELATEIAYLAGGLKTHRARLGMVIDHMGPFADETRAADKVARKVLVHESYADAVQRGAELSPERLELQRIALGTLSIGTASSKAQASTAGSSWQDLSAAEQEVAILAAAGWPNGAIGARRGTSSRTIDGQMSSILKKLMITSREEIIRFVPAEQRGRIQVERQHGPHQGKEEPQRAQQQNRAHYT